MGHGTVLDSGTTFTYVPSPAYQHLARMIDGYALAGGLTRTPGLDPQVKLGWLGRLGWGGWPAHGLFEEAC